MFAGRAWAEAFINTLENEGCKIDNGNYANGIIADGIEALEVFASSVASMRGPVFGSSAAEKLGALLHDGMKKAGVSSTAYETALCFIVLMVRKNVYRHIDSVINEAKKLVQKKNGIVRVIVEYAVAPVPSAERAPASEGSPPEEDAAGTKSVKLMDEGRIKELVKNRTGASGVDIVMRNNQELIGGYLLRIGDEIIDASIRSQLGKLEACLAAGEGGSRLMEGIDGK